MFRRTSCTASLIAFCIGSLWISYLSSFKAGSISSIQRNRLKKNLLDSAIATTKQNRTQVRKDIWIAQPDHHRLHNRIESANSLLILQPKGSSMEVVEELQQVQCWSQEKIFVSNGSMHHQMRQLRTEKGIYKYQTQTFESNQTHVSFHKIPGLSLMTTSKEQPPAFLAGTAEAVSFSVQKGVPLFQARQFKASLGERQINP